VKSELVSAMAFGDRITHVCSRNTNGDCVSQQHAAEPFDDEFVFWLRSKPVIQCYDRHC
jgi:hypothetical protein